MNDRLALGTVQFGLNYGIANRSGLVGPADAEQIIAAAAADGVRTLDTAISYGTSESVLGACNVKGWDIVTKLPAIPDGCDDVQAWSLKQIEASLSRLRVESVHGVLLHRPDQLLGQHGCALLGALRLMQAKGYTRKIGVSIYAPTELDDIFAMGEFDIVQAPLSILDRRLLDSGWVKRLSEHGVELHTRSVFLQGLLLMSDAERPAKFDCWPSIWDEWKRWLLVSGLSPVQACLRYVLSVSEVDRLVVGVDSLTHLQDILSATVGALPDLPNWPTAPEIELINPAYWGTL
jgi:aryl-alcohol dehydrogenase-like predicted oxidoreductase